MAEVLHFAGLNHRLPMLLQWGRYVTVWRDRMSPWRQAPGMGGESTRQGLVDHASSARGAPALALVFSQYGTHCPRNLYHPPHPFGAPTPLGTSPSQGGHFDAYGYRIELTG